MTTRVKLYFVTETLVSGEGEARQTFSVSELMEAGAMLAALESGKHDAGEKGDVELVPGHGVEFSADKRALMATVSGYPQLRKTKDGSVEKVFIDMEPLVTVSENGWTAKMTIYPPVSGKTLPDALKIKDLLERAGVRSGIRENNIAACLAVVRSENRPNKNQVVARGRLPVNGENSRLRIDIGVGPQVGKELGDGHIDFHERRLFTAVEKGQLLATKVAATRGMAGIDVYGKEIEQVPGKDLLVKTTDDVVFDETTGELRAAIGGVLSAVTGSGVRVTAKLVLSGDIDFQTGNVESHNGVEISGSVKPGFKVTAGADVVVGGSLDGAQLKSRGNVVIRGGIIGEDAFVEAEGDVDTPVIEFGTISSKGSVRIAKEAYYAKIRCLQNIDMLGQAKMISSDLYAGGSITVFDVDTDTSPNSILAAATMPERYARYEKLLIAFHKAQAAVDGWQRRFGSAAVNAEREELQEDLVDAASALSSYNLIPGVGERDRYGGLRYACRQKITVKGVIRSGAVIRIGNSESTLKKTYVEGYFALNGDSGKLEFFSATLGAKATGELV